MCVRKADRYRDRAPAQASTEEQVARLVRHLQTLPVSERSGCALGVASRLIEFAAYELAGRQSPDDVADLIDCAARMDYASVDVQAASHILPTRRVQ